MLLARQEEPLGHFARITLAVIMLSWGQTALAAQDAHPAEAPSSVPAARASSDLEGLLNLDIEQLAKTPVVVPSMDIAVTSVTREESTVGRSAAAVFVITQEMIRRSGAKSVPEALRMAPGLEVAQINSSTWAITSRGFNGSFANKLLVLIDGRTVYTPVFSGVYWDAQDVFLEDVERIEVVRGPGGTLWGANAVNGVISIITKNAKDTQGAYINVAGGSVARSTENVRYGGQIGEDCYYRIYGKYLDNSPFHNRYDDGSGRDAWNQGRFGFRSDWDIGGDRTNMLTILGEHYVGNSGGQATFTSLTPPYSYNQYGNTYNTGQHLLARWNHVCSEDSDWTLQSYFDNFQRDTILNAERIRTFDLDFQYRFLLNDRHKIAWGAGYRYIQDHLPSNSPFTLSSIPASRNYYVASQFVQDEITLSPDLLQLILGCKLEQNSYTHFEYQPTIRAMYTPDRKHTLWGAVSRAVHTPSRIDDDMFVTSAFVWEEMPYFSRMIGNPDVKSEVLMAYELGFREQTTEKFSWDIAAFYNVYDELRSMQFIGFPPPDFIPTSQVANGASANTYGVELAANYAVSERWRLYAQYTYLHMDLHDDVSFYGDGRSPCNQIFFRSSWDMCENVDFDLMARYVDTLEYINYFESGQFCPNYIEMDLRLAWRPRKHLEVAVVGQNLLHGAHYEFIPTEDVFSPLNQIPRSVYGSVTWKR
ncbi:MAG: TonB-dependent receptor [Pirellulaceae bacterium]|nr:TonB-dependent receptor [Pirellulaceae bacterium]